MLKKYGTRIPIAILLFFVATFVILGITFQSDSSRIVIKKADELTGFTYENDILETLPVKLDANQFEETRIYNILPEDFTHKQTLLFRSSLQNITVYLDGDLLYQMNYDDEATYASMWHTVPIPSDSDGETLMVEYSSPFQAMSGVVNAVYYGDEAALTNQIVHMYGFRLLIGLLTVVIGLFLMVVSMLVYKKDNKEHIYLGLFAVLLGLWIVSESRMVQLFTENIMIIGSLSYIALVLFPAPLFLYLSSKVQPRFEKLLNILAIIFLSYTPMVILMDVVNIYDYFESVLLTQILLLISGVALSYIIVVEKFKEHNKGINHMFLYVMIIGLFGFIEVLFFFLRLFDYTSSFMVVGVMIVMTLIVYHYILFLIERFKGSYKQEFYQFLAYHDPITGAKNRLAFEQAFEELFQNQESRKRVRLVYFDLNNLKLINDDHGHLKGDQAIIDTYHIIEKVFGLYGETYRIGGDEFACLASNIDDQQFQKLQGQMIDLIREVNTKSIYQYGVSIGTSIYLTNDSPKDIINRADTDMYRNKKYQKNT